MNNQTTASLPEYWGMAGVFPGEFELWKGEQWPNTRRFIADRGFSGGSVSVSDLLDKDRMALLIEMAQDREQVQMIHTGLNYRDPVGATIERLKENAETILDAGREIPLACVGVVVGNGHRFDREVSLDKQFSILTEALTPLVDICLEGGLPVAIENHGDYYVSDLVELCAKIPGLEILLDTGNCYLIGERPDLIPDEAYPLIRATHWKDHYVRPVAKTLHFELTGATLGQGHVGLDAIYKKMLRLHPSPEEIIMQIEWVPDPGRDALQCFADSCDHLNALSGGKFPFANKSPSFT